MTLIGDLLTKLNDSSRNAVRNIEKVQKKLVNVRNAVTFNETCIEQGLLPKYSNIRLHDPAIRQRQCTLDFRRNLVQEQLKDKKAELVRLEQEQKKFQSEFAKEDIGNKIRNDIYRALHENYVYYDSVVRDRISRKLNTLYGGQLHLRNSSDSFVNLSSRQLSDDEKEFLNLGINCHIEGKFNAAEKYTEIELLFQQITDLERDKKVKVKPEIKPQLLAEATKNRSTGRSKKRRELLPPRLKEAAKKLRQDENIVIRRADKTSIYVILDKKDYDEKINCILSDGNKFQKIRADPTDSLKKRVNKLISAANAEIDGVHFREITGDYKPGYLYGNVKVHKEGNPLRPIISQIPTPTYDIAKQINKLVTPYIPTTNTLKSTDDFVTVLRCSQPKGILASLDVQSLFTNVPVTETVDIILKYVYENDSTHAPRLPREILRELLLLCTKEAPFLSPSGHLYKQIDGVAMGSPLGVLFANAYMCFIEEKALAGLIQHPYIYKRYIDDIFLEINSEEELQKLKIKLEELSVLHFTHEVGVSGKLPFLDVNVDITGGMHTTSVHRKKTDGGRCMNGRSVCPTRYKRGVIRTYVRRALKTCSTWELFDTEISHVKKMLVNNNYLASDIEREIKIALDEFLKPIKKGKESNLHVLYYKNQMSGAHKLDEQVLKHIIKTNVTPTDGNHVTLRIYYRSRRTSNLIMRNNENRTTFLKSTNIVYKFTCPHEDCQPQDNPMCYVGHTTTTLSRRLTYHKQNGELERHMRETHGTRITRQDLVDNTEIIHYERKTKRLRVLEAVHIHVLKPRMNIQREHETIITLHDMTT